MLTTIVDQNHIPLWSMESDGGKPCSQVNDSSRQGAGSLQASDQCQSLLTVFLLALVGSYSSGVQQPTRARTILNERPHIH